MKKIKILALLLLTSCAVQVGLRPKEDHKYCFEHCMIITYSPSRNMDKGDAMGVCELKCR